jgi:hypothetical protein
METMRPVYEKPLEAIDETELQCPLGYAPDAAAAKALHDEAVRRGGGRRYRRFELATHPSGAHGYFPVVLR